MARFEGITLRFPSEPASYQFVRWVEASSDGWGVDVAPRMELDAWITGWQQPGISTIGESLMSDVAWGMKRWVVNFLCYGNNTIE